MTVFVVRVVLVLLAAALLIGSRLRPGPQDDRTAVRDRGRSPWRSARPQTPRSLALQGLGAICLILAAVLGLL